MSNQFIKTESHIIASSEVAYIDCNNLSELEIIIHLKSGEKIFSNGINAIETVMAIKPSALEGVKRIKWHKFVWFVHNMFGHPLMQIFALLGMYRIAFYIHDKTVPNVKQCSNS